MHARTHARIHACTHAHRKVLISLLEYLKSLILKILRMTR